MGKPMQKEGNAHENPTAARTEKSPLSERSSQTSAARPDEGVARQPDKKPSVKEKLERYQSVAKQKESERSVKPKEKPKTQQQSKQTVHQQPKPKKKSKER